MTLLMPRSNIYLTIIKLTFTLTQKIPNLLKDVS